jgi:hypothetical protein
MGMVQDMKQRGTLARVDDAARRAKVASAWDIIYKKNYAVDSAPVERVLKEQSLVPNSVGAIVMKTRVRNLLGLQNAFSQNLSPFGFNFFSLFVVDLMHEFELGVWKALFIHLLRMLEAMGGGLIDELDRR